MKTITQHDLMKMLRQPVAGRTDPEIAQMVLAVAAEYPEVVADLKSYQDKPTGCSCAGRIARAVTKDLAKTQRMLDTTFGAGTYELKIEVVQRRHLRGTTLTIAATPGAWTAAFEQLAKTYGPAYTTMYHGVHLRDLPDGKWLLLFY